MGACTFVTSASAMHANDECEFDDNCAVSIGEDGAWVSAWLWIREVKTDD